MRLSAELKPRIGERCAEPDIRKREANGSFVRDLIVGAVRSER